MGKGKHKWMVSFPPSKAPVIPPVGYRETSSTSEDEIEGTDDSLVTKQGWSIALGPWKSLPMNLLLLFMVGNQIGLFPVMMVGMMLYRPVQAMLSYKEVFDKLTGNQSMLQKLLYLSANVLILGLAMWKLRSMGLLPTAQSDWVEFIEARNNLEVSIGGIRVSN